MHIRLTEKLCEVLDGIDLRPFTPGDIVELCPRDAWLLLNEGWAETIDPVEIKDEATCTVSQNGSPDDRST